MFAGLLRVQKWQERCVAIDGHTRDIAQHICAKMHLNLTVVLISRPFGPWKKIALVVLNDQYRFCFSVYRYGLLLKSFSSKFVDSLLIGVRLFLRDCLHLRIRFIFKSTLLSFLLSVFRHVSIYRISLFLVCIKFPTCYWWRKQSKITLETCFLWNLLSCH